MNLRYNSLVGLCDGDILRELRRNRSHPLKKLFPNESFQQYPRHDEVGRRLSRQTLGVSFICTSSLHQTAANLGEKANSVATLLMCERRVVSSRQTLEATGDCFRSFVLFLVFMVPFVTLI